MVAGDQCGGGSSAFPEKLLKSWYVLWDTVPVPWIFVAVHLLVLRTMGPRQSAGLRIPRFET
jgi:hypothetical protein